MPIKSLLVIDDDLDDQYLVSYVVRAYDAKIEIIEAFDGREALALLHRRTPDAIILDINMPGMNGFDFLEQYEASFETHVPVVAMLTNSMLERDRERARKFSFIRGYFRKPLTLTHMAELSALLD